MLRRLTLIAAVSALAASGGCKKSDRSGRIAIDGSSTVYPITEAVAAAFQKSDKTRVTIGVSGTGGGFKKFCAGETALSGASRPIKPSEVDACKKAGIDYVELPVAYDGIAVVVHPANTWVDKLTVAELKALWEPAAKGKISRWSQVRAGWPDTKIQLFGPGVDSGTYDYFTHAIVGTEHSSRPDFIASENDNVLVQGVAGDKGALGFFGYAYYVKNKDKLKLVPVDAGKGPVIPSPETVEKGVYQPLSRPIFIYVSVAAAKRDEVTRFVDFYLKNASTLVPQVGYMALPEKAYALVAGHYAKRKIGSLFGGGGSKIGVTVEELLAGQ